MRSRQKLSFASVAGCPRKIEKHLAPLAEHNPCIAFEQLMTGQVSNAFEESGKQRDAAEELVFALHYRGGADSAPL